SAVWRRTIRLRRWRCGTCAAGRKDGDRRRRLSGSRLTCARRCCFHRVCQSGGIALLTGALERSEPLYSPYVDVRRITPFDPDQRRLQRHGRIQRAVERYAKRHTVNDADAVDLRRYRVTLDGVELHRTSRVGDHDRERVPLLAAVELSIVVLIDDAADE